EFADSVSQLVTQKFHELSGGLAAAHARHKALAGIVMTQGLDVRQAQVVVLSSGTKCISGDHINDQGLVVNDCHAEIVARRALVHFLYAQLELHLSKRREDGERSIFVRSQEGGYRLREDTLFHLYVSTSPCGDARLNSPHEITTDRKRPRFYPFYTNGPPPLPIRAQDQAALRHRWQGGWSGRGLSSGMSSSKTLV
ncbi:Double-stranded RNA-specific editase B2, partial [Camelus dromedarius]